MVVSLYSCWSSSPSCITTIINIIFIIFNIIFILHYNTTTSCSVTVSSDLCRILFFWVWVGYHQGAFLPFPSLPLTATNTSNRGCLLTVFELHGSQSVPGPSLIFTTPYGPCCCGKLGYRGSLHTFTIFSRQGVYTIKGLYSVMYKRIDKNRNKIRNNNQTEHYIL